MSFAARLAVYAKLLLASQKSLLLVGAPGTGKTRLARLVARLCTVDHAEPLVVVGREGLSYDRLVAYYSVEGSSVRLMLGELARAVLASWARVSLGLGPRYLVLDEVNRCNADVVLGEVFTALDIEHRMSVPVLRGAAYAHARRLAEEGSTEELGLSSAEELEALRRVLSRAEARGLEGLPMPYSFRLLATMNVYDRAQLYRLGYAFQRRFAYLYVPPPFEEASQRLDGGELDRRVKRVHEGVLRALSDPESSVARQAVRELAAHEAVAPSLVEGDHPAAPLRAPGREELGEALRVAAKHYAEASRLVAYAYHVASRELRVELGVSVLVDVLKLYAVSALSSPTGEPLLTPSEAADLALSSLVLPQLSAAVPKVRSELLVVGSPEESRMLRALLGLEEALKGVLGEESLSARVLEGFEVPRLHGG